MTTKKFREIACVLCALAAMGAQAKAMSLPEDARSAVVLAYFQIAPEPDPDSGLSLNTFEEHLDILYTQGYTLAPLPAVVSALERGEKIEPKTVVLTFDGGHSPLRSSAFSELIENRIPFTIFLAPDGKTPDPEDLRALRLHDFITFGIAVKYERSPTEQTRALNSAIAAFRSHFDMAPHFVSYHGGVYTQDMLELLRKNGFRAGLTQNSGAVCAGQNLLALPRFTMTEPFAQEERFRDVLAALPLPVSDMTPGAPLVLDESPIIGFTLPKGLAHAPGLSCFVSGQESPSIHSLTDRRVELRLKAPLSPGRTRLNCTLPESQEEETRWRWLGMLLYRSENP